MKPDALAEIVEAMKDEYARARLEAFREGLITAKVCTLEAMVLLMPDAHAAITKADQYLIKEIERVDGALALLAKGRE